MAPSAFPILGELKPGTTQRHSVKLPGAALADDEPRPVITVTGARPGPVLFVNAGVHGGEYPAVEAVIQLGKTLDPQTISGTVILMPVLNLPAFRQRTMFVCPVDNVNPNRVFPGDPEGSYSEQMTHALMNEFVRRADAYIDLHGGDIPEALVPFVIGRAGDEDVDRKAKEIAIAFGLPYVLSVSKPVQVAKGLSSYAAGAAAGVPSILAEAGGVGQMQRDAVEILANGVRNVMTHLGMLTPAGGAAKFQAPISSPRRVRPLADNIQGSTKLQTEIANPQSQIFSQFEWVYATDDGVWYPEVAAGDAVTKGQQLGIIGNLFGDVVAKIAAPADGVILFLTINPSVRKQGVLMGIGAE